MLVSLPLRRRGDGLHASLGRVSRALECVAFVRRARFSDSCWSVIPSSVLFCPKKKPNSKRAKVNDDIEMGGVSEEMGYAECDTLDTKTGEILDPGLVAVARSEEMRYMDDTGMFEDARDEECYAKTGKPPVDTKWVDVNKGTLQDPVIRCRLVARDFKPKGEPARGNMFATVPPPEAKTVLLSIAAS